MVSSPLPVRPALPTTDPWAVPLAPIAAFLAMQLLAMSICLIRMPLAAGIADGERMVLQAVILAQIGTAAILSPSLTTTRATSVITAACCWPALILAAAVAAQPLLYAAWAAAAVSVWVVGLGGWHYVGRPEWWTNLVRALAVASSLGVPVLGYFATEFAGESAGRTPLAWLEYMPIALVWSLAEGRAVTMQLLAWAVIMATGVVVATSLHRKRVKASV